MLRTLGPFLRPHRGPLAGCFAATVAVALLALPIPLVQGRLLDRLAAAGPADPDLGGHLLAAVGVSLGCLLARAALARRTAVTVTRISLEVVAELTTALHRAVTRMPLAALDRHPTGGLMARLTADVGTVMIFLNTGTVQLAADLVLAAGATAALAWFDGRLALVAAAAAPLYLLNQTAFAGPVRRAAGRTRAAFGRMYALLGDRLPAAAVVRAFAQERAEAARLDEHQHEHAAAARAGVRLAAGQAAAATVIAGLATAAVLVGGAAGVAAGRLSPGDLLAVYALAGLLFGPFVRLAQFQSGWAATHTAVERMAELLDAPVPAEPRERPTPAAVRGELRFDRVTFRYGPHRPPAVDGVSFLAGPGRTVGLAGPGGSGKSTLLLLAAGLHEADGVTLDGAAVRAWPGAVVLVPQRPVLFAGTVRSNLRYAVPDAADERLWAALAAVELDDVVRRRGGLDLAVGPRGAGLSGGQRQRLALARAVLAYPAVLLLDDCTSALDGATERRVLDNLDRLFVGRTRVVASHRPEPLRRADAVLTLDAGRAVERRSRCL
jgi:ABC-type multidrug transport system fused ATPase/permease subunit